MSHTTVSSNGHHTRGPEADTLTAERRISAARGSITPEALIERQLQKARAQLADARENLKAGRRRVVELEEVISTWELFAAQLRRNGGAPPPRPDRSPGPRRAPEPGPDA